MTDPVRITPGTFGYAEVNGADQAALALLAPLGFTPPRRAPHPVSLHTLEGPLTRLALVGEAASRLERAGYTVEVDPKLRLSRAGEQALEILGELSERLGELADVLADMDDIHDLADVAGQMLVGRGNVVDTARAAFTAGAEATRRTGGFPFEREGIAAWFQAGADSAGQLAALAASTAAPPPTDPFAERTEAARACSPAARTATSMPVSATGAPAHTILDPRRARA
ncbi:MULTISPECIES: hypothetical protein [unclassified Kitasatospora]|uniref:hypothetical protein n=1 Tax=unclassified Kitasatospora TaxID=2633591 RepID=UPI00070EDAD2|nr:MULTISPECIES: hypothetical protein [unclassified Kitasatospora]KQV20942.1 hypothetical protein ASC99_20790 [Kitasatospora sp. Root107]KRB60404.1 hypothetical protein ASE03_12390 [Kitasatospora sp. Root187]